MQSFDRKRPLIYITGGSGGAHVINVLIEAVLEKLLKKFILVHQTGNAKEFRDFDRLEKKRQTLAKNLQERYVITKFVDPSQVISILEKADLVISRSGMNTMTELLALGKPCLLVPLPYGQRNEQMTNDLFVQKIGIGKIARQEDLTGEKLFALLVDMIENIATYKKAGGLAKGLIIKDSAQKIITVIEDVNKQT